MFSIENCTHTYIYIICIYLICIYIYTYIFHGGFRTVMVSISRVDDLLKAISGMNASPAALSRWTGPVSGPLGSGFFYR